MSPSLGEASLLDGANLIIPTKQKTHGLYVENPPQDHIGSGDVMTQNSDNLSHMDHGVTPVSMFQSKDHHGYMIVQQNSDSMEKPDLEAAFGHPVKSPTTLRESQFSTDRER